MGQTFTWFEFLLMSEDMIKKSAEGIVAEPKEPFAICVGPSDLSITKILDFASSYRTVETDSAGFIELSLN